ncbi:hypothetical protein F0562_008549 [Nyssa sinensis]|uniref:RING-type E3 ubiquitin transferase n=1 Tax=Nyssa sinensis TaxID=561372 RepID=A0A5J5A8B8_9ASTE|nr:hypothetical protein F0562_008549 [Nyssa sinensis]
MASAAIFSSLRRRRSPSVEAFLAPVSLNESALIQTLIVVANELLVSFSGSIVLPRTVILCFKEVYILLYRAKILLDYCSQSSRLWLLIQNCMISSHFRDLDQEISTVLGVLPLEELELCEDVREQIELLKTQSERGKLFIDQRDEELRMKLFGFHEEFGVGNVPDCMELRAFFVDGLGIHDGKTCRNEIEFLEELICTYEGDVEPTSSVIKGFIAFTQYCRFLIFGIDECEETINFGNCKKPRKGVVCQEIGETFVTIPKDFCCPISLDLMRDPVIVSTGQTYDRTSIYQWMEEGNNICPKTGQLFAHTHLVQNKAVRSLIVQWCTAHGIPFNPPESANGCTKTSSAVPSTRAVIEANRATVRLLIEQLSCGSDGVKTVAARELRFLAKFGKVNRAYIAEAGAISLLQKLLSSPNPVAQENSVTAILNLSIYEKNKSCIMEEAGCLDSIVKVLRFGHTEEARENAAATLFSLSAVHNYKMRITGEEGAVEALVGLLRKGTPRGKKDAVNALYNLCTHLDNCPRMIDAGAVTALVEALETEGVAEEAAGALGLLVRQPFGAEELRREEMAVPRLVEMMRRGTSRGMENAVSTLLELCRVGGSAATERVAKVPAFAHLLKILLYTGTNRTRRKAASLARVCERSEAVALPSGQWGVGHAFTGNSAANLGSSFANDTSVSMSITVPVV